MQPTGRSVPRLLVVEDFRELAPVDQTATFFAAVEMVSLVRQVRGHHSEGVQGFTRPPALVSSQGRAARHRPAPSAFQLLGGLVELLPAVANALDQIARLVARNPVLPGEVAYLVAFSRGDS
jgi:hypothetical protein